MVKNTDQISCDTGSGKPPRLTLWAAFAAVTLLFTGGCVAQHGEDFGSWIGRAEPTSLVRITRDPDTQALQSTDRCLLLPIIGDMSEASTQLLQQDFFREACNYLPANVSLLPANVRAATYASANNLYPDGITLNVQEACRLGALLGVNYVLAVQVRDYRPYHPQVLTLRLSLLDVNARRLRICMEAAFDARQQQLVTAMSDYLQARRARKYDTNSLEIMLRSPAEYAAFSASFCCQSLASTLSAVPCVTEESKP